MTLMMYPEKREDKKYSYKDYLNWPDSERWELIGGVAYGMAPAPSRRHQKVLAALLSEFYNFLKGKDCEVYGAPFDVRLPEGDEKDEEIKTVVQPDLVVVCDKSKLDDKGCKGSPDLVVEIVSPSTASMDYIEKLALYERHGVKEYWIVHPADEIVMVYKLAGYTKYGRAEIYARNDKVGVGVFDGLEINLKEIFTE
jgi:Uma2 family endonuclease